MKFSGLNYHLINSNASLLLPYITIEATIPGEILILAVRGKLFVHWDFNFYIEKRYEEWFRDINVMFIDVFLIQAPKGIVNFGLNFL